MSCTPRRPHASKRVTFGLASRKERLKQPHLSSSALARLASELAVRSLEPSTRRGYGYALKHWSTFTKVYSVAHLPSRSSLALFVAFLSRRVKDQDKVLSALAFHFRPSLPDWDSIRSAPEVLQVLRGARKTAGVSVRRSPPLLPRHLVALVRHALRPGATYDDVLAAAVGTAGFGGLHRPGELAQPNARGDRDPRKVILRSLVVLNPHTSFAYHLPYHKADRYWRGSDVVITAALAPPSFNSVGLLALYLARRDARHGRSGALFLRENGKPVTRG